MAKPDKMFQLLHIKEGLEPELEGPAAKSWEELEEDIVRLLASGHFIGNDMLFLITLDGNGRLEDITDFDPDFMREMEVRAAGGS